MSASALERMIELTAPAMSHLICTAALVSLISVMPLFYSNVAGIIQKDIAQRELKEIADCVSNTFTNSFFLVNSADNPSISLTKELKYLPSNVENSLYIVKIDGNGNNASKITACLKDNPSVSAEAWLSAGLQKDLQDYVESGTRVIIAGCYRNETGTFIWIGLGDGT